MEEGRIKFIEGEPGRLMASGSEGPTRESSGTAERLDLVKDPRRGLVPGPRRH